MLRRTRPGKTSGFIELQLFGYAPCGDTRVRDRSGERRQPRTYLRFTAISLRLADSQRRARPEARGNMKRKQVFVAEGHAQKTFARNEVQTGVLTAVYTSKPAAPSARVFDRR
jgi:hypothetical protein